MTISDMPFDTSGNNLRDPGDIFFYESYSETLTVFDSDNDGIFDVFSSEINVNSVDLDDDNDGILDHIEEDFSAGIGVNILMARDTDSDGIPDSLSSATSVNTLMARDTDGDGVPDFTESLIVIGKSNDGNDGVPDFTEDLAIGDFFSHSDPFRVRSGLEVDTL